MARATQLQRKAMTNASRAQGTGTTISVTAPVGGLNTKDALAEMPETDAIIFDNMFPQPTWVEVRGGRARTATFTGNCLTLMPYVGILASTPALFGAVDNAGTRAIYRMDNAGGGPVAAAVKSGLSSALLDYAQFGTGAGEFLLYVNGLDAPVIYDGSTWQDVTTTSTPYAMTGGPSPLSSLSQIAVYKQRLWFAQKNSFNVYYLPQNVVGGALTLLNIGPNFKLGGYLSMMVTISIDNSAGTNDYFAFISNVGEVVMFQGYDPSQLATWSMSAHFRIGQPIVNGRQGWQKMGMDAALLTQDGLILLSEAMLTDRSQNKLTLSDKIRYGINLAQDLYQTNPGWCMLLYPPGNKLILNVPTTNVNTQSFQYVMNTLTGAWCSWGQMASPLNGQCFENFGTNLYMGGPGSVDQIDVGLSDNGAPIQWAVKQAFNFLGDKERLKRFTMAQPTFQASGGLSISLQLSIDFDNTVPVNTVPITQGAPAVWNVALWSAPTYWGDAQQVVRPWLGVQGIGYCAAIYIRGTTANLTAKWMETKILFEPGGQFYGK